MALQTIRNQYASAVEWIKADWEANPLRLMAETYNAFTALTTAIIFAFMAPHVPYEITYPLWLSGTALMIFCGISRGSFGMVVMSVIMTIIDTYGYARFLLQ
jgi:hypothetical protein